MSEANVPELKAVPLPKTRALTEKERALIDFLLAGPLGREELRNQVQSARVWGVCSCGCPSAFLEVDPGAPQAAFAPDEVPLGRTDAVSITAYRWNSRSWAEVTLHVDLGYVNELEIWGGKLGMRPRVDPGRLEHAK
jgi:hypothetical protein